MATAEFLEIGGRSIAVIARGLESKTIVVFCHGMHSSGRGDHFDQMDASLAAVGLGSVRFDQFGNGASAGRPVDRRFDDWVSLTIAFVHRLQACNRHVLLLGNSMGGAAALAAVAQEPTVTACVAWVPGLHEPPPRAAGEAEFVERDEEMSWSFWEQYERAETLQLLGRISVPTLVLLATNDQYNGPEIRMAAARTASPAVQIEELDGYEHAGWTDAQTARIVDRTVRFFLGYLA